AYGLCPGIFERLEAFGGLFGIQPDELVPVAAGLNHFTWLLKIRFKNGEDVYRILDERLASAPDFEPLCSGLYRDFGYYPSPGDTLAGEYISYAWDLIPDAKRGLNHIRTIEERGKQVLETALSIARGDPPPEHMARSPTSAGARVMSAIVRDRKHHEYAVNLPNDGLISQVSSDIVVEVPATVDGRGVHGSPVGTLPKG